MATAQVDPAALELRPEDLRAQIPLDELPPSWEAIEPLERLAGQQRALDAIRFGLAVHADGYNIAISGPRSSGKNMAARLLVREVAEKTPPPRDWVYLHNFSDPYRPRAVALPPALGDDLQRDLEQIAEACRTGIPRAFESDSYQERRGQALQPIGEEHERMLDALRTEAGAEGFVINVTPMGFVPVPKGQDGRPISPEAYGAFPEEVRQAIDARRKVVQERITAAIRDLRQMDRRSQEVIEELDREVTRFVVGPILDEVRERFGQYGLRPHFDAVEQDILKHLERYKRATPEEAEKLPPQFLAQADGEREQLLQRYTVNLFITHGDEPAEHAPVVEERQPTYYNLFGRLDYQPRLGSLVTDFTQIRPGALHRANGGYLILQALDLLQDPRSWIKLKRSLKSEELRVEDIAAEYTPLPTANLIPEAIPLNVKVLLVGPPTLFALLDGGDPDFPELFKIRAEFEPDTPSDADSLRSYAGFVRRTCDDCHLRPFDREALAELIRFGARLAGRKDRLSARYGAIGDLCQEASQIATEQGMAGVTPEHVLAAIRGKQHRSGLIPDRMRRMIAEGTLHVQVSGTVVGQVNGLAVYQLGSQAFGTPMRITCRAGIGQRGVVAIEREVERSGAIHSKGVLVLTGYLTGQFGRERPLAFTASLTFEQSYDEVDGDSASSAELYAILTALARTPMRQDIAVTGSVDQFGNIQPVGGVTEKVEGFFDVCREVGFTGTQGVIIPRSNVVNLTLRPDIVQAAEAGRFRVWAIARVEEGLEILTGIPAGHADETGQYPVGTIFRGVTDALDEMQRRAPAPGGDGRAAVHTPEGAEAGPAGSA